MLQDASIIVLSSIDWSFNRQNPQEVALALAAGGHRVLFIENTGVRRAELKDMPRLWSRFRNWLRARGTVKQTECGVHIFSPLLLPLPYSRSAVFINTRVLVHAVRRWLGAGGGPLIVITFLPTPLVRAAIRALSPALVVYYCIDRLAESSPGARKVVHSEYKLFSEADFVLVTSDVLYKAAAELTERVYLLPSGVCVDKFERAWQSRTTALQEFTGISEPVVGYIGSLRSAIDIRLLARVAELAPDLQFVLAGPRFVDVTPLARRPNVRLLDAIPHDDVMKYMVRFDAGVLPYLINEFTDGIMPVKLKEYLAAGLPVVATPLPEVIRFAEQHPGLVKFAAEPVDFVTALRAATTDRESEAVEHRVSVARQYDWSHQMARLANLIDESLPGDGRNHESD